MDKIEFPSEIKNFGDLQLHFSRLKGPWLLSRGRLKLLGLGARRPSEARYRNHSERISYLIVYTVRAGQLESRYLALPWVNSKQRMNKLNCCGCFG